MSSLTIGRLVLGPPPEWHEAVGDPITNLGGAAIPAPRQALRHAISVATYAADGATDTVAARLLLRRQLRSMLNNLPLKLQGFIYIQYSDDPEQNGWYVPDFGQLVDIDGSAGLATGVWKLEQVAWTMQGHRRINREARQIRALDLRTGLWQRDQLGLLFSTGFSALPALSLVCLPNGATSPANAVSGQMVVPVTMPTGRDGGVALQVAGQADLSCVAFDQLESARNLSDVVVYDRRGNTGTPPFAPATGAFRAAVLADSPVAYYRQDETAGTAISDLQGTNNGTYSVAVGAGTGIAAVKGLLAGDQDGDQAIAYSTSQSANCGNNASLQISTGTLECLINTTQANDGGYHAIAVKTNAYGLFQMTTGHLGIFDWGGGADRDTGIAINDGKTHHILLTFQSGVANGTKIYLDGQLVLTTTMTVSNQASAFGIAASIGTGQVIAATIDEVAIYNTVLSAARVTAHYNAAVTAVSFGWEEVYGPDYPWNWLTAGQPNDCPVLENGLVRVRYDASVGIPGFRVDVWNGTAYVEQGKMTLQRNGESGFVRDDTWVSASLVEYTPDRAVMMCVLRVSGDSNSRERVYVTVERGMIGCVFEAYAASKAAGTQADVCFMWDTAFTGGAADLNASVAKADTQTSSPGAAGTVAFTATAGSGGGAGNSALFSGAGGFIGASSFASSENWVALLRYPTAFNVIAAYQATLVALQAGAFAWATSDAFGYGVTDNDVQIGGSNAAGAGYVQAQLSFAATQADQVMEAEAMTLGANTALATVASSSGPASNNATTATRTTDANAHVTRGNWPNGFLATYRVFVRVKVSASTGHFYAKTGATTGAAVTTTSTSYVWLDLGEIVANATTLEIHAWLTAAATVTVDRVEAVLVQDRVRGSAIYSGSRDAGQAALYDARTKGAVVAR